MGMDLLEREAKLLQVFPVTRGEPREITILTKEKAW
jgi:hypothetical protein